MKQEKQFSRFVVIWLGQTVSLVGSGLTGFALSLWLFQQTGNATPIAITGLSQWLPRILLSPVAGVLADKYSRKTIMILADTFSAVATGAMALLVLAGSLEVWHIYAVAMAAGIAGSFQGPAFTASIATLVKRKDFARAAGMRQAADALEMIASPIIAGVLIGFVGLAGIIFVDLATFLVAMATLAVSRIPRPPRSKLTEREAGKPALRQAASGFRYVFARPGLWAMLIYFATANFATSMMSVIFAPLVLSFAGAPGLGVVQTVSGVAMLIGSVVVSVTGGPKRRMMSIYLALAVAGFGFIFASLEASILLISVGIFVALFPIPIASGAASSIWLSKVPADLQGRVSAASSMTATAMIPIAYLLTGFLSDFVFEPLMTTNAPRFLAVTFGEGPGRGYALVLALAGVLLVVVTGLFLLHRPLRRVESELPDMIGDAVGGSEEGEEPALKS